MARMIPKPLPSQVAADPRRAAERKVYSAFDEQLPEKVMVFFSRSWLGRPAPGQAPVEGEADFVVAHPEHGILVVEVKGGRIRYDAVTDTWFSRDRHGAEHTVDNPFRQALRTKHALVAKIKQLPAWKGRWIEAGYGVIFPDSARPDGSLGIDTSAQVTAFAEDMSWLDRWLDAAFRYWTAQDGRAEEFGARGMAMVERLLGASFELRHPLAADIDEDRDRILHLTEEQFNVLDLLSGRRRVGISGGAGTGKTMLAMEKARRLADEGFRVLLTCFNRPLADFLGKVAAGVPNLTAANFHTLCYEMAQKADCPVADPEGGTPPPQYFEKEMPASLMRALECLPGERFDAIIVDEGQDFAEDWWIALQLALADPDQGILYVFFDNSQQLYRQATVLPQGLEVYPLVKNLRNTKPIHRLASRFCEGIRFTGAGPEGRPVEFVLAADPHALEREVSRLLHRLVRDESLRPDDVAVLTGRSREKSALGGREVIGAFHVCCGRTPESGKVVFDSIRRFKGLERPVVILVELEDALDQEELLYVGITRANAHLIVVGSSEVQGRLDPGA